MGEWLTPIKETPYNDRVVELFKAVARGEVKPAPLYETFKETYCGNVPFQVGDAKVMVFNDCDSFDYVDSVEFEGGTVDYYDGVNSLIQDRLTEQEYAAMERVFMES